MASDSDSSTSFASSAPSLCSCSNPTKRRKVECSHPVIHQGLCFLCGRPVDDDHSLPFGFIYPLLRISHDHAKCSINFCSLRVLYSLISSGKRCSQDFDRMREATTQDLLGLKKLHLVLDLDHTLLHTVRLSDLTSHEKQRVLAPEAERNNAVVGRATMLRPFVRDFLREADSMFELTLYTMGGSRYSSGMAKLLDPDGDYFGARVISRDDCTVRGRKSLDVVLAQQSSVVILDDSADVWPDHGENLILIDPFFYFSHGSEKRGVQPCFIDTDEGECDDTGLVTALQLLKEIHRCYFDPNLGLNDVRDLLRQF